jgi:translocation and assembly module TamB
MKVKKAIRITLIVLPALVLLVVASLLVMVHTQAFDRFVLAKIIDKAEQSTGFRIHIQRLVTHWSPFTADFYGVVVHGQERSSEAPILETEHLGVRLGIRALLERKIDVNSINIDQPIVHIWVDASGRSNLPKPLASNSSSNMSVTIRHVSLRDGVVNYNDFRIPLTAELDDLRALVDYDASSGSYRGSLGYRHGSIVTEGMTPVEHHALVQFSANREGALLDPIVVSSGKSRLELRLNVANFANPKIEGKYDGFVVTRDVAELLQNSSLPRGDIILTGNINYQSSVGQSFLKALMVQGRLDSGGLIIRANQMSSFLQSIHGTYRLQDGNLRIQKFDADILEGHLTAQMEMVHLDQHPSSHVNASLRGLSLEKLSDMLPATTRQNVRLLGRANLNAQATWSDSVSAMKVRSRIEISGPTAFPQAQENTIPVNGVIDVQYDGAKQTASFDRSQLQIANSELMLNGVVSRHSSLNIAAHTNDLHELTMLASVLSSTDRSAKHADNAAIYDLHGAASFNGQVTGSTHDPRIMGQLSFSNLEVQGSKWRSGRISLDASSTGAQFHNGYLESATHGLISFAGRTALVHWTFRPESPLSLQAKVTKLSVLDLERLAKFQYPVTGELSGEIDIAGSELQPVGHGSLQITKGSAWNEPIRSLKLDLRGDNNSLQSNVQLQLAGGTADAKLTYVPKTQHYDLNLSSTGLNLDQLQSVQQRAGSMAGVLTMNVIGQGTLKEPQLSAYVQIPRLQVSSQTFSEVKTQLQLARQHAEITLESMVEQGYVHANGTVDLTGDYQTNATVDVRALPIGPLLAKHSTTSGAAQDLQGFTEVHALLSGPLKNPARLEGRLEVPRLNFAYKNIQLANDRPLRISYREGVAKIEQARIKGSGTDFSLQGVVPVQSSVPLNVGAKGELDLELLQLLSPDVHASGRLEVDLHAGGGVKQLKTEGGIRIVNTSLSMEGAPISVTDMNGQLSIANNRLQIDELHGTAGGGTISAHGSATYGKESNFAMDLHAKGVRIRPTGIRSILDGDLQLNGTPQKSQLSGQVLVDRLSFQEGFDLATVISQLSDDSTVSTPSQFASNMNLSVRVQSARNLDLASSQVSIAGSANLSVTGTAASPVILGRITLTSGELFFQGKRFEIQSGTIAFSNPARTEPVLNLYVKTVVEQFNITVNFSGPLNRLKTNYTSEPSLPPLDIINLLAFGQTTAERASNASTPASLGAESVLAQGVAGQVAKGVQNLTGISQLTIDPTASNNQNPGAQVAIQQRVTGSILLTFSTDVTSTQRQTVQLQYQPKRQVKISVLRDEYGGYGVDVKLHKVF